MFGPITGQLMAEYILGLPTSLPIDKLDVGRFKRGAYHIAHDLELPIVPLTINGPFDVLKRGSFKLKPHKMELIIHEPIPTKGLDKEEIPQIIEQTKEIIYSGLWEKYK